MTKSYSEFLLQEAARPVLEDSSLEARHSEAVAQLRAYLTPVQREFIDDPNRLKLARCGRRAGKTVMDAVYLIVEALSNPNRPTLYLGLTQDSAKKAIWPILTTMLDMVGVPYDPKVSGPRITFENGSFIQLFGADAANARERLRGQKFALIIVDEMGFFTEADGLIDSMLPMLADYAGTMCMTSSPGYLLTGLFYEADQGDQKEFWSQYHWTLADNPLFQKPATDPAKYANRAEEEFDFIARTKYGGDHQHPAFRREYKGEWVADDTSLIYPYAHWYNRPGHNVVDTIPTGSDYMYGIGIDLGSVSANAIVVLRYSMYEREATFVEVWKDVGTSIDDLGRKIQEFEQQYDPTFIVADVGGYGKGIVEEVKRRYSLPIVAADKANKSFHQRIFGNDLRAGLIKVHKDPCLQLLSEWDKIVKDARGEEVRGQENHAADAALYIYRKVYTTHLMNYEPPKTEEDRMIEQLEDAVRRERMEAEDGEWARAA